MQYAVSYRMPLKTAFKNTVEIMLSKYLIFAKKILTLFPYLGCGHAKLYVP